MTVALRSAARSDVGLLRSGNEDSGYAGDTLLVVADGMGGHAAGELASSAAIATMSELETTGLDDATAIERLAEAVVTTSERIASVVEAHPEFAGMGTTLTSLAWLGGDPGRVAVLHVGDSRAYLLRDGALTQLTRDHTYVQTLIDSGRLTREQAEHHPRRNLLMRAIDGRLAAEPDVSVREARVGDRFLVCSDGLSGVVAEERLQTLLQMTDRVATVSALVDAALEAGAPDNVTCVVADVVDIPDPVDGGDAVEVPDAVVVGAAGEQRNRDRLPGMAFPADAQPDQTPGNASVVRVSTATLGAASSVADVYHEVPGSGPRRRRSWLLTAIVIGVLAVAAILAGVVAATTQRQFYIGNDSGYVAIFRGLPASIGPWELHSVEQRTDLTVDQLPDFEASQVEQTIPADTLQDAQQVVATLRSRAQACVTAPSTPGCPATGTGSSPTSPSPVDSKSSSP